MLQDVLSKKAKEPILSEDPKAAFVYQPEKHQIQKAFYP
jgi:hypothetical protein